MQPALSGLRLNEGSRSVVWDPAHPETATLIWLPPIFARLFQLTTVSLYQCTYVI